MVHLLLLAALAAGPHADTSFASIVREQLRRHPEMVMTDLYKLTHQAAFGAEHAIADSAEAARWLEREWATLDDAPREAIYDTIAPGGAVVRLNLRAWRDGGGSSGPVLRAFLETGRTFKRNPDRFERYWATVVTLAREHAIPFEADSLAALGRTMRQRDYPAVGHSESYRARSRPAYRVVRPELVRVGGD